MVFRILKDSKDSAILWCDKMGAGQKVEEAYEANFARIGSRAEGRALSDIQSGRYRKDCRKKQMEDNFYRDLNDNHFEI